MACYHNADFCFISSRSECVVTFPLCIFVSFTGSWGSESVPFEQERIKLLHQRVLFYLIDANVRLSVSTEVVPVSTWRRISSCVTPPVLVLRPSLTCGRWALGSASRRAITWSSHQPLNRQRRPTLSWGCSLRNCPSLSESSGCFFFRKIFKIHNPVNWSSWSRSQCVNLCREMDDNMELNFDEEVKRIFL